VTVKPEGIRVFQQRLNDIASRSDDATPVLRKVAEEFRSDQRANFARGGRPRWKPLSPEYAAWKARKYPGRPVGVLTGAMRAALVSKFDPYHLEVVKSDQLRVGSTNPVSNLFNGKHTVHKQPKRKLISLTPTRRREYLKMVQDYLVDGEL
jgi:phage gpG-like protein